MTKMYRTSWKSGLHTIHVTFNLAGCGTVILILQMLRAMFRIINSETIKCILKTVLVAPKIKHLIYIAKNLILYKSDLQWDLPITCCYFLETSQNIFKQFGKLYNLHKMSCLISLIMWSDASSKLIC